MKKILLSVSVLASLFVAGCSNDDEVAINEVTGDVTTHYMTVNIVSTDDGTVRATDEDRSSGTIYYENGTTTENQVNSIRFYFFTENGQAAYVKPSGAAYVNYYDWPNDSIRQTWNTTSSTAPIESQISATVVISTKVGDKLPRTMMAVINPTEVLKSTTISTLSQLRSVTEDYAAASLTQTGTFVMSNSVYLESSTSKEVNAVFIENTKIADTPEAAKEDPINIYVERNVAKVSVTTGYTDDKIPLKYKAGTEQAGQSITVGGQPVYLELTGWSLTSETDGGYLNKQIDLNWGSTWWKEGVNRCTWALNAESAKNKYVPNYLALTNTLASTTYKYTNENAAPVNIATAANALENTKFIVGGRLCKANGDTLTIVQHLGQNFVDETDNDETKNLLGLKASILDYLLSQECYLYKEDGDNLVSIEVKDIEIVANNVVTQEDSQNNCYVHAGLSAAASAKTWRRISGQDTTSITVDSINTLLKDKETMGEALVWKKGQTYYYAPIVHRNDDPNTPATYGVVRNHVYKVNITNISGLGTPVYDPSVIIYPEKPNPDDHYIAASIDILSWRVITSNYSLDW